MLHTNVDKLPFLATSVVASRLRGICQSRRAYPNKESADGAGRSAPRIFGTEVGSFGEQKSKARMHTVTPSSCA